MPTRTSPGRSTRAASRVSRYRVSDADPTKGRGWMASSSKRQTTMAKMAREQAVREKRARKLEKKEYRKQAAAAGPENEHADPEIEGDEPTTSEPTASEPAAETPDS